ncbi:MAG: acyl-CoA reductase [Flavobacteriaceae bacterium]|nr:acyl-CoA reductase [Flavobacteriaceae bacterium]
MNSNLNKRLKAFSDLGKLFSENINKTEKKEFHEWNLVLNQTLAKAKEFNTWFTENNLNLSLKNWALNLTYEKLSNWVSNYDIENKESKTVAIIMAGNIPMVGFHDLLCSLLLNLKCKIKLSSDDKFLIPFVVKFLESRNKSFKEKVVFENNQLKNFDAVIATGSNNSFKYFDYYFSKYPNILRKTRHSIAVLNGYESNTDLLNLSNDIFDYFGLGCRSVSKLFLPKGYDLDLLFDAFYTKKEIINHNSYVNNFDYNKAVFLMSNEKFRENGFIILKEEKKLGSPIGCLYYEYYEEMKEVEKMISNNKDNLQCVLSNYKDIGSIPFGSSQCPTLNDYADNVDTVNFLLKI